MAWVLASARLPKWRSTPPWLLRGEFAYERLTRRPRSQRRLTMIEGNFIINPIAHAYNLTDDNLQPNPYGRGLRDLLVKLHLVWNPPELRVPAEVYMSDWPMEVLARTLFLETDIDLACNMYLRLDSWFRDGLCSRTKNVEAASRWPQRFMTYVGVSPTRGLDVCLRDLEDQMTELPQSIGLKLYPDEVEPF